MTSGLIPKDALLLIEQRKTGSPGWYITHHHAFANIHIDKLEVLLRTTFISPPSTALQTQDRQIRARLKKHSLSLFERKIAVGFLCPDHPPAWQHLTSLPKLPFHLQSSAFPPPGWQRWWHFAQDNPRSSSRHCHTHFFSGVSSIKRGSLKLTG